MAPDQSIFSLDLLKLNLNIYHENKNQHIAFPFNHNGIGHY
jgi:hypothetical protein